VKSRFSCRGKHFYKRTDSTAHSTPRIRKNYDFYKETWNISDVSKKAALCEGLQDSTTISSSFPSLETLRHRPPSLQTSSWKGHLPVVPLSATGQHLPILKTTNYLITNQRVFRILDHPPGEVFPHKIVL
jgi:hypothetical protein